MAANAAGCVTASAGQDAFVKYTAATYAKHPPENSPGLADNDLKQIAADAGAPGAASCIAGHTFTDWVADLTERASRAGVNQTPTVKVNGTEVARPTGESVTAAVDTAGR